MKKLLLLISSLLTLSVHAMESQPTDLKVNGAAVLPTFVKDFEKYVILGREHSGKHKGMYDAFGGATDPQDEGDTALDTALNTAAREFYEEAITEKTIKFTKKAIKDQLRSKYTPNTIAYKSSCPSYFFVYITELKLRWAWGLKEKFYSARDNATSGSYKEKDKLAQVKWDDFTTAIKYSESNEDVTVLASIVDKSGRVEKNKDGSAKLTEITLRPYLVSSLRQFFQGKAPVDIGPYGEQFYTKSSPKQYTPYSKMGGRRKRGYKSNPILRIKSRYTI